MGKKRNLKKSYFPAEYTTEVIIYPLRNFKLQRFQFLICLSISNLGRS